MTLLTSMTADRREFLKISQAVGVGFLVMGAIGYVVKLSMSRGRHICVLLFANHETVHIPLNNVLVGGA